MMQYFVCSEIVGSMLLLGMPQLIAEIVLMVVPFSVMMQEPFTPEALQATCVVPPPLGRRVGLAVMESVRAPQEGPLVTSSAVPQDTVDALDAAMVTA